MPQLTKKPPSDDLRKSLLRSKINTRARTSDHRINKPRRLVRAKTKTHEVHPKVIQPKRKHFRLHPEQRDRAVTIFTALQQIERCANRAPQLVPQQSDDPGHGRLRLEYPSCHFCICLDDRSMSDAKRLDLPALRRDIIEDLDLLYAQHIPYTPDLTTLELAETVTSGPRVPSDAKPFLGPRDFDLEINSNDPTIPWAELRRERRRMIETQFDVLELLIAPPESTEAQCQQPLIDLDPSIVGLMLRTLWPSTKDSGRVIRHLNRYSAELGQFLIKVARFDLLSLPRRNRPPDSEYWIKDRVDDYIPILDHVLSLIDQAIHDQGIQSNSLLADRATLLVIKAAMLIHQHANVIPIYGSNKLLGKSGHGTAESYITYEGYVSVTRACQIAEAAVHELTGIGGEIHPYARRFL
ncbi:hypothetical protein GGS24DRAFT_478490 [Hypoxylon argillaceum]|nr:hypothetical protein GGS24DRAFT_478490 [Hypoxylon argillaceum]